MIIIEVFVPEQARQRDTRKIAEGLIQAVGHGAAAVQVVMHEPTTWLVGPSGEHATSGRWIVRVSMPGVWREAMGAGATLVPAITRVLAEHEEAPRRLFQEPDAWVQFIDVPEKAFATLGEPLATTDLADLVTGKLTVAADGGIDRAQLAAGVVRDPICGMAVELAEARFQLDVDEVVYGFCSAVCRDHFADWQAGAASGSIGVGR